MDDLTSCTDEALKNTYCRLNEAETKLGEDGFMPEYEERLSRIAMELLRRGFKIVGCKNIVPIREG